MQRARRLLVPDKRRFTREESAMRCLVLLCGIMMLTAAALPGCSSRVSSEPIAIGHVAPLSGPDKAAGEQAKQAILLAVEAVNGSESSVLGRRIEVRHADTHGDLEALGNEAVRLITVNRVVALLGGSDAEQADRLGRATQPYGVPRVTGGARLPPPAAEPTF